MIKEYRTHYKLTLADMERLTKVDSSYISKMERDERGYKNNRSYQKVITFIKADNKFNRIQLSKAYSNREVERGVLVNFIYKLLGVEK